MARAPASVELRVVEDFCNTAVLLRGTDELDSLGKARAWLRDGGWQTVLGEPDLAALRAERESIRAFLVHRSDAEARHRLNGLARQHLAAAYIDTAGNLAFLPNDERMHVTAAALSALFLHGMSSDGRRLKACAEPDCGFVFYDHSRSRTGIWCDMNVCGARHKMREYRKRLA